MHKNIKEVIEEFFFSDIEIRQKEELKDFTYSLSNIIVDELIQNYLLNNKYFSIYLSNINIDRLSRNMKDFIVFVLSAPFDQIYLERVYRVGFIHHAIKLAPAKINYGFWAINKILQKISKVNKKVEKHNSLISKIFKMVEYLMIEGYLYEKEKENQILKKTNWLNIQNELFIGFMSIKNRTKSVIRAFFQKDIELIRHIATHASECDFTKALNLISSIEKNGYILGVDTQKLIKSHEEWHLVFTKFKYALKTKDYNQAEELKNKIATLTKKIGKIFDIGLKKSVFSSQMAITSGINALRITAELFYNKSFVKLTKPEDIKALLENIIKKSIWNEFAWAIEDVIISFDEINESEYEIFKNIRYDYKSIYIGIKLKKNKNEYYINEIFTLLLDILELQFSMKERESSLIKFADKAESASKAKDMFLASMSHELRTPLNAIIGFSQILMMKDIPKENKQFIEKIYISGNNLLELVNTILDFAKLEAGKMQFSPTVCSMSTMFKEIKTIVEPLSNKKQIDLKLPKVVSLMLYLDCKLFKQAIINLLSNAIKFTPQNGNVSLDLKYSNEKKAYIFTVKDNGIGISQENIQKLFKPFVQVENVYQKKYKGTGLGLMITKKIIEELHKGKIWVDSKEGEGSEFHVLLPAVLDVPKTIRINQAPKNAKKILIVEDDQNYQKILINHLQDTHNLTITDSVNSAKQLLVEEEFDFGIFDFFLMDGVSSEIFQFMEDERIGLESIIISAENDIQISTSLSNFSNLNGILSKDNVEEICNSIKGKKHKGVE